MSSFLPTTPSCAHDAELLDGGGAVDVAGHQQGPLALGLLQQAGQLAAVGGLARALEAHQHDDRGALGVGGQLLILRAHEAGELLVDDLDDHLGGGQAFEHVGADAALGGVAYKVLHDLVADVGLEQGKTDLPHGRLDVGLGDPALAAQLLERGGEFFG